MLMLKELLESYLEKQAKRILRCLDKNGC